MNRTSNQESKDENVPQNMKGLEIMSRFHENNTVFFDHVDPLKWKEINLQ